jgi:F420H(2)-dependent quinone reductase
VRRDRVRRISGIHRLVYRTTGGVIGRRLVNNDILLLTTTGRRTGRPHTVPLLYLGEGERLVVVASFGGRDQHPAWYLNLVANPLVRVQISARSFAARATTAGLADRTSWWPRIVDAYQGYARYQARTGRQIPVVFLDPVDEARSGE